MQREVKFRGMNAAGEMVYGDLIQTKPNKVDGKYTSWIKPRCFLGLGAASTPTRSFIKVDSETVGQYTGLKDCNGVEIYEGDIVRWGHIDGYKEFVPRKAVVEFSPELAFMTFNLKHNHRFGFSNFMYQNTNEAMEVIGNIHQNPGLINNGDDDE